MERSNFGFLDLSDSEVKADASVPADGRTQANVFALLEFATNAPAGGYEVVLNVDRDSVTLDQPETITDDQGLVHATVTTVVPGPVTITATVISGRYHVNIPKSATVMFVPAPPAGFDLVAQPTSLIAGHSTTVSVFPLALGGFPDPTYAGTVGLSSTDPRAQLPPPMVFTGQQGVTHQGVVSLFKSGLSTVTATDVRNPARQGNTTVMVMPGPATTLVSVGPSQTWVAGSPGSLTIAVTDTYGNPVPGHLGSAQVTTSDPNGVPAPSSQPYVTDGNGLATLSIGEPITAGSTTVTVMDPALGSPAMGTYTVNPGDASSLVLSGISANVKAGVPTSPVVTVFDAYGNVATLFTGTVTFTTSDTMGTVPANYDLTGSDNGAKTFAGGLTLKTIGLQQVTATIVQQPALTSTDSNINVYSTDGYLTLNFNQTTGVAGTPQTVTVTAYDIYGSVNVHYTGSVQFSSTDPIAALPSSYSFAPSNLGVQTFTTTLKTSGAQVVTVSDVHDPGIQSGTATFTVTPAATASMAIRGAPSSTIAGAPFTVTVTAVDVYGNSTPTYTGTWSWNSSDAQATLPLPVTLTSANQGSYTFSVVLGTVGSQSITVSDTSGFTGTVAGIQVQPGAATHYVVTNLPASVVAGSATSAVVIAEDAYNNRATGYAGRAHFTSSDAQAVLPATYVYVTADQGQHTFSVTFKTAGSQSLTVTDTSQGSITATASTSVTSAAAATMLVSGFPSSTIAGQAGSVTVRLVDAYGNTATTYTGTIHFTSTDAQAVLPTNYTFSVTDAGSAVFTNGVTFKTSGTQSLTATDTVKATLTSTEGSIHVTSSTAASLHVTGLATSSTAGQVQTAVVTAYDAYGNVATTYAGQIQFTSNDAQAVLPAAYNFTVTDAGTHTFTGGVTLKTAGTDSVTATDATNAISGSQTGLTVAPAAATSLTFISFPSPVTSGQGVTVTVNALDPYGNIATGYRGTVKFTSTDGQAVLPANTAYTATFSGSHAFTFTLKTAGTQSVTATDTVTASINGTASNITVKPGAPAKLAVSGLTSVVAGTAGTVVVKVLDAANNVVPTYTDTIHFTSSDGQATLPADYAYTLVDAGMHTFAAAVVLKTVGTQTVTATDTSTAITGSQGGIVVSPAAAASYTITGLTSTIAGTAESPVVKALDPYGNIATGYRGTAHFTSTDAQAALPANYAYTSTDNGVHTFASGVTFKTAGTQSLTATDTVTASITGTEGSIVITAATASKLVVSGLTGGVAGTVETVIVTAYDTYNNVAKAYGDTVRFTSTDGQATLPANYSFTAGDAGGHTFTNAVTLKTAGTQSVTATDTTRPAVTGTQTGIVITPSSATHLTVTGIPASITAGSANTMTVTAYDAYNNVATGYLGTMHFTTTDAQGVLPANYGFTGTDNGAHTFTGGVTLKTAATQSVTAQDVASGGISGTETGIVVHPSTATQMFLSGLPSSTTAGTALTPAVMVEDAYNNVATGYRGTVTFTSSDHNAVLPPPYTFVAGDSGAHNFTSALTLKTAGTQSVTVTDATNGLSANTSGIAVAPASAASLAVTGIPNEVAGSTSDVTVTAYDAYNNVATGYTGTVTFSSTDPLAVLPSAYTFIGADAGAHLFPSSVTLKTAGSQSVSAADTSMTGTESGIVISPNVATHFLAGGIPSTVWAGSEQPFNVTAMDAYGNVATGYAGTVLYTSSDPLAVLPSNGPLTSGTGSYQVMFNTQAVESVTVNDSANPTITGSETNITVIAESAGLIGSGPGESICARTTTNQLKCWGYNPGGELGYGDATDRGSNANSMGSHLPYVNVGTGRTVLSGGSNEATCVVLDNNQIKCWGANPNGQLGYGDTVNRGDYNGGMGDSLPQVALGTGRSAISVSPGTTDTCALLDDGTMRCWGDNTYGELGLGDTATRLAPSSAPNLGTGFTVTQMSAGNGSNCAVLSNGKLKCWGLNMVGELGMGDTNNRGAIASGMGNALPAVNLGTGRTALECSVGGGYATSPNCVTTCVFIIFCTTTCYTPFVTGDTAMACAVLDNAAVKCWGDNSSGQLGVGDTVTRGTAASQMGNSLPVVNLGTGRTAQSVVTGTDHACALLDDNTVKCWGNNSQGQLGLGDTVNRGTSAAQMGDALPAVFLGTGRTAVQIIAETQNTCAFLDNGTIKCWGANDSGRLGLGDSTNRGTTSASMTNLAPVILW